MSINITRSQRSFPSFIWTDWLNFVFLLCVIFIPHSYTWAAVEVVMQDAGVGLRAKRMMTLSFFHLLLISVLMWSKLYYFAHRQAAPCHPSLCRLVNRWPLIKCWGPYQVRPECPLDLCLLNSKLWCIKAQTTTNGFACIKHLCCSLIKEPFTTAP